MCATALTLPSFEITIGMEVALENPRRESLTAVSRTIEAVERSYRGAQDPSGSSPGPRTYADRLTFIANLVVVQIQPGEGPAAAVGRLIGGAGGSEEVAGDVLREVLKLQDARVGDTVEIGGTTRLLDGTSSD